MDPDTVPMAVSLLLIGAAGIATAVAGVLLPAGRRLEALIGLVAGAGAGLMSLAAGVLAGVADDPTGSGTWFLVSTIVGLTAAIGVLFALVRRRSPSGNG